LGDDERDHVDRHYAKPECKVLEAQPSRKTHRQRAKEEKIRRFFTLKPVEVGLRLLAFSPSRLLAFSPPRHRVTEN
jgi:hypothetical protein